MCPESTGTLSGNSLFNTFNSLCLDVIYLPPLKDLPATILYYFIRKVKDRNVFDKYIDVYVITLTFKHIKDIIMITK